MKGSSGFTLLELMVGISVAAILSALAIPSFINTIRATRGVSDANGILAVVTLARNEAVKRDATVTLCATNGTACSTSASWDQGYLLYYGATTVLRTEVPLSGSSTINLCLGVPSTTAGTPIYTISFNGNGQPASQAYFDVNPTTKSGAACPSSSAAKATGERYVVVRPAGRTNVCDPTNANCGK